MENAVIEKKKKRLELEKEKIANKERLMKLLENKKKIQIQIEIGKLATKSNIDFLDLDIIFGAFLEISESCKNDDKLKEWKKISSEFTERSQKKENFKQAFSVTFSEEIKKEIKVSLKNIGFKWNSIRKEFYGFSDRILLEDILKNTTAKIILID